MADSKITALTAISTVDPTADPLVIVDVSDTSMAASGTTKKSTINQLLGAGGTATLASATITGAATVGTTLGVTGVSTFAAGTALLPALTTTGDTNTGIYYPAADTFAVTTGGTERYRVDSSGNVGIGVTPSAWVAGAKALQFGAYGSLAQSSSGNIELSFNSYNSGAGAYKYLQTDTASLYRASSVHSWFVAPSGTAGNAITWTQAMTLDASGNLSVGTTNAASIFGSVRSGFVATGANGAIGSKVDDTGRACLIAWNADTSGDNNFIQFFTEASITSRGSITYNRAAGQVSYNITSDYRLKEDVKPLTGALNRISSLKPSTYKFKETGFTCEGFIAHELAEVIPAAVTGEKDAVNQDGSIKAQGVDLSKVVPILVAAIQELTARVQTLEAK